MEKQPLSPKKKMIYAAAGLIILLVLFLYFSTCFSGAERTVSPEQDLEARLSSALAKMQGVGAVRVVIRCEDGALPAAAEEGAEAASRPVICGAVVVAEGAEDIRIRLELQDAVQTLLGVRADQVEILY